MFSFRLFPSPGARRVSGLFAAAFLAGLLASRDSLAQSAAGPETSAAAATASAPAPLERPALPPEYAPMDQGPRFNSNQPPLVKDTEELLRLRSQGPPWIQQVLAFPPESELLHHLGRDSGGTRDRAAASVRQVINPRLLPPDFARHLIPLSHWAVLYDDWRKQGGTDVFLTKFEQNGFAVLLLESHNHVIALVRDLKGERAREFTEVMDRVHTYADLLLTESLKPLSVKALKTFRTSVNPLYVYGWYVPRIEALTGGEAAGAGDLITTGGQANESSSSAGASAVRYFSNGEFAAFMVLKPVAVGELKNPFEPRFTAVNRRTYPGGERPFWEESALIRRGRKDKALSEEEEEQLRRRQIEEYLGSYLYDEEGRKLSDWVPIKDLERAFLELSRDQQLAIVERKMVDEYLTAGMRAFASKEYDEALRSWTRLLQLDPENPRAAILLQLAVKERARQDYGGNTEKARRNRAVAEALDAIERQQTVLALKRDQQSLEEVRDRAIRDYRTRGLSFMSESNFSDALREWEKILKVDPGNPTAMLFKDICETRLRETEGLEFPRLPGSAAR